MKCFIAFAVLVTVVGAIFFCPDSEDQLQCLETQSKTAYCLTNGQWVCGKCSIKAQNCFGQSDRYGRRPVEDKSANACYGKPAPSCGQ